MLRKYTDHAELQVQEHTLLNFQVGHSSVGWKKRIGAICCYSTCVAFYCYFIFPFFEIAISLWYLGKRNSVNINNCIFIQVSNTSKIKTLFNISHTPACERREVVIGYAFSDSNADFRMSGIWQHNTII